MEGFKRGLKRSSGYYPKIQFDAFLVAVKVAKSRARKFLDLSTPAEEGLGRGIFPPHFDIYTLVALLPYPAAYQPLAASCHRNSFSITRTSLPSIRDRMPEKYVPL